MRPSSLRLYTALSRLPGPSSYAGKLFFVAFLGTHVPLIGVLVYTALSNLTFTQALPILGTTLGATLVGTGATLWALHRLLAPVRATADALEAYVDARTRPDLPTQFDDRAGRLMRHTQETIDHLDALLQFKSRMLGVVSHDARGPATSILMAADAIGQQAQSGNLNAEVVKRLADSVEKAVRYQMDVTESLLEVARHGDGTLALTRTTVPVSDVAARVRDMLAGHAHKKSQRLTVDVDPCGDLRLHTDVQKLEQVLSNLLSNAVKYTPEGGTVLLGVSATPDAVTFRVSDDGPGIPESVRADLFEAYRKAPTANEDSVGLGLWICKTFTHALGGTIHVDSEPGEGTTFRVRFPRDAIAADAQTEASTQA